MLKRLNNGYRWRGCNIVFAELDGITDKVEGQENQGGHNIESQQTSDQKTNSQPPSSDSTRGHIDKNTTQSLRRTESLVHKKQFHADPDRQSVTSGVLPIVVTVTQCSGDFFEEIAEENENDVIKKPAHVVYDSESRDEATAPIHSSTGSYFITSKNFYTETGIAFPVSLPTRQTCYRISSPVASPKSKSVCSSIIRNKSRASMDTKSTQQIKTPAMNLSKADSPNVTSVKLDKENLQDLLQRLTTYVHQVRSMVETDNRVDSHFFLKSVKILEREIQNLQSVYDRELDHLRRELENVKKEKNKIAAQSSHNQQVSTDLEQRLTAERNGYQQAILKIKSLQQTISELEEELMFVKSTTNSKDYVQHLQSQMETCTQEVDVWKRRAGLDSDKHSLFNDEQLEKQELDDKLQQALQKFSVKERIQADLNQNLQERLDAAMCVITELESQIRERNKSDSNIAELLQQMHEATETELRKFQMECQEQSNKNLAALKGQLENDAKSIQSLKTEKYASQKQIMEMQVKIQSLEAENYNLADQQQKMEQAVEKDRNHVAKIISTLEKKRQEIQDLLFNKLSKVNSFQEISSPVRTEITAMKCLLDSEEERLRGLFSGSSDFNTNYLYNVSANSIPQAAMCTDLAIPSAPPASAQPIPDQTQAEICNTVFEAPHSSTFSPEFDTALSNFEPISSNNVGSLFLDDQDPEGYPFFNYSSPSMYLYETSPGLNRVSLDLSPPPTPRPVGPVRAKSAPSIEPASQDMPLVPPSTLGQGRDYFAAMFRDGHPEAKSSERPITATHRDFNIATNRTNDNPAKYYLIYVALGDIKIVELHPEGKYVRLVNESASEVEFGGYIIQQNIGGHPVAVFRFPPCTKFPASTSLTVWAGGSENHVHNPPSDFVWKEQTKWGVGPQCTTILCRPNGQAIAWTTAAHRFSKTILEDTRYTDVANPGSLDFVRPVQDPLTEFTSELSTIKSDTVYLNREKQSPLRFSVQRHPHGHTPTASVHPQTSEQRPYAYGNDNVSRYRQSRSQSARPHPIPGRPYTGPEHQKVGHAALARRTIRSSEPIANRGAGSIRWGPPSPFLSPLQQDFFQASNKGTGTLVRFTA